MPLAIESNDVGFSQRAGTSALLQALRSGRSTLFVASDAPLGKPASAQELSYGAGAAAFALGAERVIARLLGSGSVTAPLDRKSVVWGKSVSVRVDLGGV